MISVIIPIKDRAKYFEPTLEGYARQTLGKQHFEIVVIDQFSRDHLNQLLWSYHKRINILYFKLDPTKGNVKPLQSFQGLTNPAFPQNYGVKKCNGKLLVLTSPEVVPAETNLERIQNVLRDPWLFLYGRVVNSATYSFRDFKYETLVQIKGTLGSGLPSGIYCGKERHPFFNPHIYFIGALWKEGFYKLGGIEELFMKGVGFEDTEFGRRIEAAQFNLFLDESVIGIHQAHGYGHSQNQDLEFQMGLQINAQIYNGLDPKRILGNVERPWGELEQNFFLDEELAIEV